MTEPRLRLPSRTLAAGGLEKLADEINADHHNVQDHLKGAVVCAIAAGQKLLHAKKELGYGKWLPWLKDKFKGSARTAETYMRLARRVEEMPDLRDRIAESSLGGAERLLDEEFDRRQRKAALTIVDIEQNLIDAVYQTRTALENARGILDETGWRKWLSDIGLDVKATDAFLRGKAPETISTKQRPPLYLLPLRDPDPDDDWRPGEDVTYPDLGTTTQASVLESKSRRPANLGKNRKIAAPRKDNGDG